MEDIQGILLACLDKDKIEEFQGTLIEMENDPAYISHFLEVVHNSTDTKLLKSATLALSKTIENTFHTLESDDQAHLKADILGMLFSPLQPSQINILVTIVRKILLSYKFETWPEVFDAILEGARNPELIFNTAVTISENGNLIPHQLFAEHIDTLFGLVNLCMQSTDWSIRHVGVDILMLFANIKSEIDGNDDEGFTEYFVPILSYDRSPTVFNQPATTDYVTKIWIRVSEAIAKQYIKGDVLNQFYQAALEVAKDTRINAFNRWAVLQVTAGTLTMIDAEQLEGIVEISFDIGAKICESEGSFGATQTIFELALDILDSETVYSMIKSHIEAAFESGSRGEVANAFSCLQTFMCYATYIAQVDFDFIKEYLIKGFDSGDNLILEAVCNVIDSFDETFASAAVESTNFLLRLVPLFMSENDNVRQASLIAANCLCQTVDTKIDGFFEACWEIHDQVPEQNVDSFTPILAEAIHLSDIGDEELDVVKEWCMEYVQQEDADVATSILVVISMIINSDLSAGEEMFEPAMNLVYRSFESSNIQTQVNAVDFVDFIFENYKDKIVQEHGRVIDMIMKIAKKICTDEAAPEEEEDECEDVADIEAGKETMPSETAYVNAISCMCRIAKILGDKDIATKMQECILQAIAFEDSTNQVAKDAYQASRNIVRLLSKDDAEQMFINFVDRLSEEKNPRTAADALGAITKILHHCAPEMKEMCLAKAGEIIETFFGGEMVCVKGQSPFDERLDYFLMTNMGYLISDYVRTPSENVDQVCEWMLQIIATEGHAAAFAFLGAYSDAIEYGTCSGEMINRVLEVIPDLISSTDEPDLQQNIFYLLNVVVQKHRAQYEQFINDQMEGLAAWYQAALEQPSGFQRVISNAGSFFLTVVMAYPALAEDLLEPALNAFPPYDTKETVQMLQNLMKFVSEGRAFPDGTLGPMIKALANLLLMTPAELAKSRVTQELYEKTKAVFKQLVRQTDGVSFLQELFEKSRQKIGILSQILDE